MPQENKRFWISWWTQQEDPTIVQTDFDFWLGGERGVQKYFPDYEERFCQEVEKDWTPEPSRFPGFTGKV